jgi:hypothetical protein
MKTRCQPLKAMLCLLVAFTAPMGQSCAALIFPYMKWATNSDVNALARTRRLYRLSAP